MKFHLVNLEAALWSGDAEFVTATGSEGELGIAKGHAPLLSELAPGYVEVRQPDGEKAVFYVSGGILEVQPDSVTLLADVAVHADKLDYQELEQHLDSRRTEAQQDGFRQAAVRAELAALLGQLQALRRASALKGRKA
ncbi:MAG: ATP synthase F1 subunit epsilon [Gammaproteobacteria bacterium]